MLHFWAVSDLLQTDIMDDVLSPMAPPNSGRFAISNECRISAQCQIADKARILMAQSPTNAETLGDVMTSAELWVDV